jgi:hypothetical protein
VDFLSNSYIQWTGIFVQPSIISILQEIESLQLRAYPIDKLRELEIAKRKRRGS